MSASALSPSMSATSLMPSASEKTVRQSSRRASHLTPASQTVVAERIIAFLRQRHPYKTADNVSAETGVPAGTVQKWIDRGSAPSAFAVFRLLGAYGPEFASAVYINAPAWLDRAVREERAAVLRAEIAALEAKLETVKA